MFCLGLFHVLTISLPLPSKVFYQFKHIQKMYGVCTPKNTKILFFPFSSIKYKQSKRMISRVFFQPASCFCYNVSISAARTEPFHKTCSMSSLKGKKESVFFELKRDCLIYTTRNLKTKVIIYWLEIRWIFEFSKKLIINPESKLGEKVGSVLPFSLLIYLLTLSLSLHVHP